MGEGEESEAQIPLNRLHPTAFTGSTDSRERGSPAVGFRHQQLPFPMTFPSMSPPPPNRSSHSPALETSRGAGRAGAAVAGLGAAGWGGGGPGLLQRPAQCGGEGDAAAAARGSRDHCRDWGRGLGCCSTAQQRGWDPGSGNSRGRGWAPNIPPHSGTAAGLELQGRGGS